MSNANQNNQAALAEQSYLKDKYKHLTERELLEKQTQLALQTSAYTNRIMLNVQFFFWSTIISLVICGFLAILAAAS